MQDEAQKIRQALRDVIDFEVGLDVVAMGMIRDVEVSDEDVRITMIFTSPMCPMASIMRQQVEKRTSEVTDKAVEVVLGQEMWKPDMMEPEAKEALGI